MRLENYLPAILGALLLALAVSLMAPPKGAHVRDSLPDVSSEERSLTLEPAPTLDLPPERNTTQLNITPISNSSLPPNFALTWNMGSLENHTDVPASSFPLPPDKVNRTNDSLLTLEGKPAILLFTTTYCQRSKWEREAFHEATSKFGRWLNLSNRTVFTNLTNGSVFETTYLDLANAVYESEWFAIRAIEADTSPFPYQPLFWRYSPGYHVPTIVFAGVYVRIGSNEVNGVPDEVNRREEVDRLVRTLCLLLDSSARKPEVCAA